MMVLLSITLTFSSLTVAAQRDNTKCNTTRNDTLFLCSGTIVQINSDLLFIRTDTLIALNELNDSLRIIRDPFARSAAFYDSLRIEAAKHPLSLYLYDLLIPGPNELSEKEYDINQAEESSQQFEPFRGLKIKSISIEQLDVFGPTLSNPGKKTDTWLGKTGNKLHVTTRKGVVRANLLFKIGDNIDPLEMAENAKLLRALPYFEDAVIEVIPNYSNPKEANVLVITKDLFPFGLYLAIPDIAVWDFDVFNQNFLGLGHRISSTFRLNASEGAFVSVSELKYRIDNIKGTFINTEAQWLNSIRSNEYGIRLFRDFFSSESQVAGGIELFHRNEQKTFFSPVLRDEDLRLNRQVLWLGQTIRLGDDHRAMVVAFSAALQNKLYSLRPFVSADSNQLFHNSSQILFGIAVAKNYFYTGQYIYQFGRTEDIPNGFEVGVNFGPDAYEYTHRYYSSLDIRMARNFNHFGYLSSRFIWDGYWQEKQLNQGQIGLTLEYFSPLQHRFLHKIRHFVTLRYLSGIRRLTGETIHVVDELGVGGLNNTDTIHFSGNQKLTANVTSMVFTPVNYYGFKLAWFTYANLAWVGPEPGKAGASNLFSGFGLGCLLRNENLVIKTIKARIGFYPGLPENKPGFLFEFSGTSSLKFLDFRPRRPQTIFYD